MSPIPCILNVGVCPGLRVLKRGSKDTGPEVALAFELAVVTSLQNISDQSRIKAFTTIHTKQSRLPAVPF